MIKITIVIKKMILCMNVYFNDKPNKIIFMCILKTLSSTKILVPTEFDQLKPQSETYSILILKINLYFHD